MSKLTARKVATLRQPGRYGDGHNLYLQITDAGVKSWLLRYERDGKERWHGLGPLHTFSLAEARERARRARQLLADGIDPIEAKRERRRESALAAARTITFDEAQRKYFAQHSPKWRSQKTVVQFRQSMREYAVPIIGRMAVADIETSDVLRVLEQPHPKLGEPLWKSIPESAGRVRGRIERVLDWCIARGHREGPNPATWTGRIQHILPSREQVRRTEHYPALPYEQMAEFMAALRAREGVAARALEFCVLTAARSGEIMDATWDQIDLELKVWHIPGDKMKAQKPHRVPLSDRAVEILGGLPRERGNEHVFISVMKSGAGLSNGAMPKVLKTLHSARTKAGVPAWRDRETGKLAVVHGFRSSFRDWASETSSYPHAVVEQALAHTVVEQALAHTVGSSVERAYRRGDLLAKRKRLMADWARYCASPAAGGTVVPMRKAAAE